MSDPAAVSAGPRCYRHPERETWVRCTRCERPICPDCMVSASVGFQCPQCIAEGSRDQRGAKTVFGAEMATGSSETVTRVLVGLPIAGFLLAAVIGDPIRIWLGLVGSAVVDGVPIGVAEGQLWRLLTSSLIPRDAISLLFTVVLTYLIGRQLEPQLGAWRLVVLWVVAAVAGNAAVLITVPPTALVVGGSATTFGLLAASIVVGRRLRQNLSALAVLGVIWLALTLVSPTAEWPGPLAGAAAGALLAASAAYAPKERRTAAFAATAGALTVVALVVALLTAGT